MRYSEILHKLTKQRYEITIIQVKFIFIHHPTKSPHREPGEWFSQISSNSLNTAKYSPPHFGIKLPSGKAQDIIIPAKAGTAPNCFNNLNISPWLSSGLYTGTFGDSSVLTQTYILQFFGEYSN